MRNSARPASAANLNRFIAGLFCLLMLGTAAEAADWQWSVPMGSGRAFLWIPPDCQQVRAVVVAQNNRAELGILEHPAMRETLGKLGIAEVWITPAFDNIFRFDAGAGDRFNAMMKGLAVKSGYSELTFAPIVPMGEALCASYPWNFAAWSPGRTLAAISIHGDAPLTETSGTGLPNPNWGPRNIDGVPGLMVLAEYEWADDRIAPALNFRKKYPNAPLAMLAEPGHGHFEYSDELVNYLAMFIRKAAEQRLPVREPLDQPISLRPVDPQAGWLVERWTPGQPRTIPPAPVAKFTGDPTQSFWCFDQEMAEATQKYAEDQIGKKAQLIGFEQEGNLVPMNDGTEGVDLRFLPQDDGVTFKLSATFLGTVEAGRLDLIRWTGLPVGSKLGHATGDAPFVISNIAGPVKMIGPNTFAVSFDRNSQTSDIRNDDVWFVVSQAGDAKYKRMSQQALLRIFPNNFGSDQHIVFPPIPDQQAGAPPQKLLATSDSGLPVYYYVREGPAEVVGNTLQFTPIPPRSKWPVQITLVAWQWGRSTMPMVKTAPPVERTFFMTR
jgi:hypothetical protein